MLNPGTPVDTTKEQNAENLVEIKNAVTDPHWTMVPMFWMTLMILILTAYLAYVAWAS